MKKYVAEFLGTLTLVFFGCGTAVVLGGFTGGTGAGFLGVLAIAMAFGLAIVAAPAVSLAVLIKGGMSVQDFVGYVIAQVAGAFAGSAILSYVTASAAGLSGFGANGYGALSGLGLSLGGAIAVEVLLTFVFIMTILGVTSSDKTSHMAGLVIGLTLTFVHIIGIPLTGTSVNPARSLAPAVFQGGEALSQVWVFIVAPFAGAVLAALAHKALFAGEVKA